jgi:small GTP-binding protein
MCRYASSCSSAIAAWAKLACFQRFIEKKFTENSMPTLGVDYKIKSMQIEGRMLKLMVWDTAGQEKFSSMQKNFYQASDGMILVFSLTDRASFDHIDRWLERIYNEAPRDLPIMLIGRFR